MNFCKIAQKLKLARLALDYSQEYVSYEIGVSQSKLSRIESGSSELRLSEFFSLTKLYRLDYTILLKDFL